MQSCVRNSRPEKEERWTYGEIEGLGPCIADVRVCGKQFVDGAPDGTDLKQLTRFSPATEVLSASYSPDGRSVVFSMTGRGGSPELFAIRPDGRGLRQITRTAAWDSAPDWGPK